MVNSASGAETEIPALNLEIRQQCEDPVRENSKPRAMVVRMSAGEWRKTHPAFKTQINGQNYVLRTAGAGTSSDPVEIEEEPKK